MGKDAAAGGAVRENVDDSFITFFFCFMSFVVPHFLNDLGLTPF
jgi:hypothetical protein